MLTFGGAYAVLPYVFQGAVQTHEWLTATQMMNGLALGKATPDPLITVVAFVGFVGGWGKAVFCPEALFLSGVAAAAVVTFFTFLPSFIFILASRPLIESNHNNLKFTAPLTPITAAVVGVILNLALFFTWNVPWPTGFSGPFDWASALIVVGAALALFRFKVSVMPLLAVCAALGLAVTWLRSHII